MSSILTAVPPPVILLSSMLIGYGLSHLDRSWHWYSDYAGYVIIVMMVLGLMLIASAGMQFVQSKTTLHPNHPERTKVLVTDGIYRFSRNPMYLGMLVLLIAWVVWLSTWLGWLAVLFFWGYVTFLQIIPEERILSKKFASEYQDYAARTRRWF